MCRDDTDTLYMIVLVSLIVLQRELIFSTTFRMVHAYIAIHSVVNNSIANKLGTHIPNSFSIPCTGPFHIIYQEYKHLPALAHV